MASDRIEASKDDLQAALDSKTDELNKLKADFEDFKEFVKKQSKPKEDVVNSIPEEISNSKADEIIKVIKECNDNEVIKEKSLEYMNTLELRWNQIDAGLGEIQQLKRRIDYMDQYYRRNSLLLHGYKNIPKKLFGYMFCEWVAEQINTFPMLAFPISPAEIDCAHPMPTVSGKTVIIVKFVRRAVRDEIFYKKKFLKHRVGPKISVTEHLTAANLGLLNEAKKIVESKNVFSKNCKVYAKWGKDKFVISDTNDLKKLKDFTA